MPKELEAKLRETAASRRYPKDRADRYVYGTMARLKKEGKVRG